MEPEKMTMNLEEMELMHLTHTAGDICKFDPVKTREQDSEFADLIEKARAYMNLALDAGIAKLSKVDLKKLS